MNVSLICACKNRYDALRVSLSSWLAFDEIKEIIIVDWSSDNSITDLLNLDGRIKIIEVPNQKYFNQPQPLNLALSQATGDYILKVDSDYIINPYYNFFDKYTPGDGEFLSGKSSYDPPEVFDESIGAYVCNFGDMVVEEIRDYCNNYSPWFMYLTGLLMLKRKDMIAVGGYNENLGKYYSYEDDEIFRRLSLYGLKQNKIFCDHYLTHLPHQDIKRIENFEGYDSVDRQNCINNMRSSYSTEGETIAQAEYAMASFHTSRNKEFTDQVTEYKVDNKTFWEVESLGDNHYKAKMKSSSKLENFPTSYYISLEESVDRQESLKSQFSEYGVTNLNGIISKRFDECDDKVIGEQLHILDGGTIGCNVSHLKAIKHWYENTSEDYGFFCEDDLSLEPVQYWNFTWSDFVNNLPSDWGCVQLCSIRSTQIDVKMRERSMYDWSVTAYIITRDYAKKIIDRYIREDSFDLTIPGTIFYPMPETVLFYDIGKVYAVDLFVEDQEFNSTFTETAGIEGGRKDHHVESYEHVINWWKSNSQTTAYQLLGIRDPEEQFTGTTDLEKILVTYSMDTENAKNNFDMGVWYENDGHTAPALSYYLRAAERSEDIDLTYESLIRGSYCYEKQGTRDGSSKSMLQQALMVHPHRPEAYFLLARFAEKREWWQDAYIYACQGLEYVDHEYRDLYTDVDYSGSYALYFIKSLSGWRWGKVDEARSILVDLKHNYDLNDHYRRIVENNISAFGVKDEQYYIKNFLEQRRVEQEERYGKVAEVTEKKIDVVLQGKYDSTTREVIKSYLQLPFINNIIVSCWKTDEEVEMGDRIKVVRNDDPETWGTDNRNLQIVSSRNGLNRVTTDVAVKMRSDQIYTQESMERMMKFYFDNCEHDKQLFVAGMYPNLLFHPRDHVFWGKTNSLKNLFGTPLEIDGFGDKSKLPKSELWKYYKYFIRTETYIGGHYCSRIDPRVKRLFDEPQKYLYDEAPEWNYAKELSDEVGRRVFKSFPKSGIDLEWPKKQLASYPYDDQEQGYFEQWYENGC